MADLLSIFSLALVPVKLPSGHEVFLRPLPAGPMLDWLDSIQAEDLSASVTVEHYAKLLVQAVTDKDGKTLFTSLEQVMAMVPPSTIMDLGNRASTMNAGNAEGKSQAKKK